MKEITEEEEFLRGCEIARVLKLKYVKDSNGKHYDPKRFDTTHGTKTILGLYRTVRQLVETPFAKPSPPAEELDPGDRTDAFRND